MIERDKLVPFYAMTSSTARQGHDISPWDDRPSDGTFRFQPALSGNRRHSEEGLRFSRTVGL